MGMIITQAAKVILWVTSIPFCHLYGTGSSGIVCAVSRDQQPCVVLNSPRNTTKSRDSNRFYSPIRFPCKLCVCALPSFFVVHEKDEQRIIYRTGSISVASIFPSRILPFVYFGQEGEGFTCTGRTVVSVIGPRTVNRSATEKAVQQLSVVQWAVVQMMVDGS